MNKKKVYVVGGDYCGGETKVFTDYGWGVADHMAEANLVCFTGGSDVSPVFYGQQNTHSYPNFQRDVREIHHIEAALNEGIPMVGICRGGQLLNVMSGGKMWQDGRGHTGGNHGARRVGVDGGPIYSITSCHHQHMIPAANGDVLVMATHGVVVRGGGEEMDNHFTNEAIYYKHTNSLCVQWHPEFTQKGDDSQELFHILINSYLMGK